jgi:hypothetical protein
MVNNNEIKICMAESVKSTPKRHHCLAKQKLERIEDSCSNLINPQSEFLRLLLCSLHDQYYNITNWEEPAACMQVERPSFVQIPLFAHCSLTQNNGAKNNPADQQQIQTTPQREIPTAAEIFARAHKRQTHTHS